MSAIRVLIAPDSFKGSISATDAARAIGEGWGRVRPSDELLMIPQADGGEGTLDAIERSEPGAVRHTLDAVTGPAGHPVPAWWLVLPDGTAVVELAISSGIALMPALDPLGATSRGLGEVIAAALDAGCSRLVIALGSSASTDGGVPLREALGGRRPPARGAVALSDVRAPLLGPRGAAAVFAPQKGASPTDIVTLEQRLTKVAEAGLADPETPGAGAAGGVGYALLDWGATLAYGALEIARISGLSEAISSADLVITGEGAYDASSHSGKVVGTVLSLGTPGVVIAGVIKVSPPCPSLSLSELAGSAAAALKDPAYWLSVAGAELASKLFPVSIDSARRSPG